MSETQLVALIRDESPIGAIAEYLDALEDAPREHAVTSLHRADQRRLFEKAADGPTCRLSDFVPRAIGDLVPVHHPGRNTVATFTHFQKFQKRFARPRGDTRRLFGYNASNAFFITPGYFVAYETDDASAEWACRGGVVIDYHMIPDAEVPAGWPKIVPNSSGLQRFVYHLTRDFMRRVSKHATIGRASREDASGDKEMDYWFTLCRRDAESTEGTPR
jgi:hypothetical protein